ncbi:MAG: hypothetical protein J5U17_07505 [Candidatus Methanoperedens sp.]|nr:hypothetical protein [Candidatus Methanoperedens sp.]MCE8427863.1 hypothetical protein [Candidatus Methanoperedens sp.]
MSHTSRDRGEKVDKIVHSGNFAEISLLAVKVGQERYMKKHNCSEENNKTPLNNRCNNTNTGQVPVNDNMISIRLKKQSDKLIGG